MLFKDVSYIQLWQQFCSADETIEAIFVTVEGIVRIMSVNFFCLVVH